MNAAAALLAAGEASSLKEGAALAAESIDSGRAGSALDALVELSQRLGVVRRMAEILTEIVAAKKVELDRLKVDVPLSEVERRIGETKPPLNLAGALWSDPSASSRR